MRRTFDCGIALLALLAAGLFGRTDRVAAAEFGKTRKHDCSYITSAFCPCAQGHCPGACALPLSISPEESRTPLGIGHPFFRLAYCVTNNPLGVSLYLNPGLLD